MSGRSLRTPGGRRIRLGKVIGRGGEGEVLSVVGSVEVAKLYRPQKRTPQLRRKIELMVSHPPKDPTKARGFLSLAWPSDLLLDGGSFTGFLMPRLDMKRYRHLHEVYGASDYPKGLDWEMLVRTARNLSSVVDAVHAEGYVVGDLNESNALVSTQTIVTLVDCDSMQVPDPGRGVVYRCEVGKPEYTPPELHGRAFSGFDRSPSSDLFALAALICQLLVRGRHPFSGGPGPAITDNIRAGETFFVNGFSTAPGRMPSPDILPGEVRRLFEDAFVAGMRSPGRRPDARTWKRALDRLLGQMRTCPRFPSHKFGGHLSGCPWCSFEQATGRPAFPRRGRVLPASIHLQPRAISRAPTAPPRPSTTAPRLPSSGANPAISALRWIGALLLGRFVRRLRNTAIGCAMIGVFVILTAVALQRLIESPPPSSRRPVSTSSPPAGSPVVPAPMAPASPAPFDPYEEIRSQRDLPSAWETLGDSFARQGKSTLATGAAELARLLHSDVPSVGTWKSRVAVLAVLDEVRPGDDEWLGGAARRAHAEGRAESAQALYHLAHLLDPTDREWLAAIEPRRGLRVRRGIDWKDAYGSQDGGAGAEGVVIAVPPETDPGWVEVEWSGREQPNWYRWGDEQDFELSLAP